jgi:hypothetical protein
MTDPDAYLTREHTSVPPPQQFATLDEAYEMLKRGALRSEVLRITGLTAAQIDELRKRAKRT